MVEIKDAGDYYHCCVNHVDEIMFSKHNIFNQKYLTVNLSRKSAAIFYKNLGFHFFTYYHYKWIENSTQLTQLFTDLIYTTLFKIMIFYIKKPT